MIRRTSTVRFMISLAFAVASVRALTTTAVAQIYGGGSTGSSGSSTGGLAGGPPAGGPSATPTTGAAAGYNFHQNYHVGFDRPEAWGLKYFASASLLSGLPPGDPWTERKVGSVNIAFEADWLPMLDSGQERIGFNGRAPEDLNQAPVFARPVIRVALPSKLTAVAAAPPPFEVFGITSHLLAFGVEGPLVELQNWMLGWRGYGQVGNVKGAFTCPGSALAFAPGSPNNPTECVGKSADVATLRYAGMEFEFAHRLARMP